MPLRGLLHLLILKILSKGPLRGVDLRSKLKEELGLEIPASAVYTILSMLEKRGFVTSSWRLKRKAPLGKYIELQRRG
jgi:DNA-binding PadR family transcriptional regulator